LAYFLHAFWYEKAIPKNFSQTIKTVLRVLHYESCIRLRGVKEKGVSRASGKKAAFIL
jgi:hypothetical protein